MASSASVADVYPRPHAQDGHGTRRRFFLPCHPPERPDWRRCSENNFQRAAQRSTTGASGRESSGGPRNKTEVAFRSIKSDNGPQLGMAPSWRAPMSNEIRSRQEQFEDSIRKGISDLVNRVDVFAEKIGEARAASETTTRWVLIIGSAVIVTSIGAGIAAFYT